MDQIEKGMKRRKELSDTEQTSSPSDYELDERPGEPPVDQFLHPLYRKYFHIEQVLLPKMEAVQNLEQAGKFMDEYLGLTISKGIKKSSSPDLNEQLGYSQKIKGFHLAFNGREAPRNEPTPAKKPSLKAQ